MSKTDKYTEYYMNGEKVDKKTVAARKDKKLVNTVVKTTKYYEAPLNDSEKAKKQKDAENASKFWREHAEMRADLELRHG
jgi:hypothetical protein